MQRKLEDAGQRRHGAAAAMRKEMRQHSQRIEQLEEESGATSTELRRTLQIVERGEHGSRDRQEAVD